MKNNSLIFTIIAVVIVGAIAFFGGMKYQQSQAAQTNMGNGQFALRGQNGQARRFGGANVGQIVSVDANSITLKLQDGSSKIINLSSNTTYSKTDSASKSDLKVGDRVAAFGTANSDGSIDAQNVQLNPMFRGSRNDTPQPTQSQ